MCVDTAIFLKHVWSFFDIMHKGVKSHCSQGHLSQDFELLLLNHEIPIKKMKAIKKKLMYM